MTTIQPTAPDKLWTPANIVTLIRICLVPVFVLAILSPWPEWVGLPGITMEAKCVIAAGIFILISCTDWIDGYLARSRGEVTDFGKFMDPLADKILVTAALIALVELAVLPGWPVLIILAREFIVSGIRMVAASKGTVIAASWYGKAKTVFQIIAIVLFLLKDSLTFTTAAGAFTNPMFVLSWTVMVIALILTVMSMLDYLVKARHLLKGSAGAKTAKAAAPSAAPTEIAALQKAIDEIFTEAMRRFDSSSGEAGQLCQDLLCSYERLQTALSGIRSIYEQTSGSLQALLPQTKEAEAWQNTI